MFTVVQQWMQCNLRQQMASNISVQFWSQFQVPVDSNNALDYLKVAFDRLYAEILNCHGQCQRLCMLQNCNTMTEMTQEIEPHLLLLLKAIVFNHTNQYFLDCLKVAYMKAFKAFDVQQKMQAGSILVLWYFVNM